MVDHAAMGLFVLLRHHVGTNSQGNVRLHLTQSAGTGTGKTHLAIAIAFWGGVDWEYWESRQDLRCQHCVMHSGFEPSVVRSLGQHPRDVWTMAKWNMQSRPGVSRP
jgi:hypothetical protein